MDALGSSRQLHNLTIRAVEIEGEPWFVAKDVFDAIGYPNGSRTYQLKQLPASDRQVLKIETNRRPFVIFTESGLYKLVMRSDKPEAKEFQHWVTSVVLPAIRKDA